MVRYPAALAVMTLTLLCGGALMLAPVAFGFPSAGGWRGPARVDLCTGAALAALAVTGIALWSTAWYRRLRADGVLTRTAGERSTPATRPHSADAELGDLAPMLMPLVAALAGDPAEGAAAPTAPGRADEDPGTPGDAARRATGGVW